MKIPKWCIDATRAIAEETRRNMAEAEGVPIKDISLTLLYRKVKR